MSLMSRGPLLLALDTSSAAVTVAVYDGGVHDGGAVLALSLIHI